LVCGIIRRDDKHHNVRALGAARPHLRERGMTGRIEEGDQPSLHLHLVGANVLCDPTCFPRRDIRLADGIEQAGLSMIHVTQNRHNRRAGLQL
jgi:hypothetical protein